MGACLLGPAPVGVSVADAQEGTDQGAWRRLPPPGLLYQRGTVSVDRTTGRITALARDGDGYHLWTYDRSLGDRPWQSKAVEGNDFSLSSPRYYFDETGRRFLALGYEATFSDTLPPVSHVEVWSLSLDVPRWERLIASGPPPTGRRSPGVAIDSPGRRLFLVGGEEPYTDGPFSGFRGDLWQLRLDPPVSWERIVLSGPDLPGGVDWEAFFDRERQKLFVVGGFDSLFADYAPRRLRAIELAGARTWFEPADSDTNGGGDFGLSCYIPELGEYVVLQRGSDFDPPDSTYLRVLDVAEGGWSRRNFTASPRPLLWAGALLCFDPATERLVYLGGEGVRGPFPTFTIQHADFWSFAAGAVVPTWQQEYSSVDAGELSSLGSAVFDPGRRVAYGTARFNPGLFAFRLDDPNGWEYLPGNSSRPNPREGAVAVFDPRGDRMIYFGGGDRGVEFGDLWECKLLGSTVRWTRRVPDGEAPSARIHASAVYDSIRHRMILFGGFAGRPLDDVWQLDLADSIPRWTRIEVRGTPPPARWGQSATYDPLRDAMVVFGGAAGLLEQPQPMRDVWVLSFVDCDAWIPLDPEGNAPIGRYRHSAVYDPVGDRLVVLWGRDASGSRFDTAALEFGPPARWRSFSPQGLAPLARDGGALFYDPVYDRAVALGGQRTTQFSSRDMSDVWAIDWSRVDRTPPPATTGGEAFILLGVGPNPSAGEVNIAFQVARPTAVHARLYDVRGRVVRDLGATAYQPGPHVLCWDGKSDGGSRLRDGVYFARIVVEGKAISGKIVLMD